MLPIAFTFPLLLLFLRKKENQLENNSNRIHFQHPLVIPWLSATNALVPVPAPVPIPIPTSTSTSTLTSMEK